MSADHLLTPAPCLKGVKPLPTPPSTQPSPRSAGRRVMGVLAGLLEANFPSLACPLLQLLFNLTHPTRSSSRCLQGGLEPRSATKDWEGKGVCKGCGVSLRPQPHGSGRELNWSRHGGQQMWVVFTCLTARTVALFKPCCSPP